MVYCQFFSRMSLASTRGLEDSSGRQNGNDLVNRNKGCSPRTSQRAHIGNTGENRELVRYFPVFGRALTSTVTVGLLVITDDDMDYPIIIDLYKTAEEQRTALNEFVMDP
uniref:Uncharacterized protein n=1 Tax=Caenorhabditis japonica TaxID=281687 RepID=A0A8R1DIQ6_CAEJA